MKKEKQTWCAKAFEGLDKEMFNGLSQQLLLLTLAPWTNVVYHNTPATTTSDSDALSSCVLFWLWPDLKFVLFSPL